MPLINVFLIDCVALRWQSLRPQRVHWQESIGWHSWQPFRFHELSLWQPKTCQLVAQGTWWSYGPVNHPVTLHILLSGGPNPKQGRKQERIKVARKLESNLWRKSSQSIIVHHPAKPLSTQAGCKTERRRGLGIKLMSVRWVKSGYSCCQGFKTAWISLDLKGFKMFTGMRPRLWRGAPRLALFPAG